MYAFAREYLADVLPFLAARCDEEETEADNDDLPIHVRARLLREIRRVCTLIGPVSLSVVTESCEGR